MPSDLSSYLATRYLTADPKPSKKRKRRQGDVSSSGLIIADDDGEWSRSHKRDADNDDDEEGALLATAVSGTSAEFRKSKKSAWKVIGSKALDPGRGDEATREADAIVASAAAEKDAAAGNDEDDDDAPAVMVTMSDGTHAGLQTGAAVSAQLEKRRRRERAEFERESRHQKEAETVYRDATGRRVDVAMKRAELRREADEAREKEERAKEALKGEKQIEAARRRREELDDAKLLGVARHADDEEMNRELKGKVRWGDTMAQFVKPKGGGSSSTVVVDGGGGKKIKKGRPVYKGAWAPNRYQIPPGYRWDGVDRSNGFEGERFKAINRRERNKGLEYSWQMDE